MQIGRKNSGAAATVIGTVTTNASGYFELAYSESVAGTYAYSVDFYGDTTYLACSSMVLDPVIVGNLQTTTLSISVSNSSPAVGQAFTYTGYLMNAEGIGLSGKKIDKQCRLPSGAWKSLGSTTTDVNGRYVATYTEQTPGTYRYEFWFQGDAQYAGSSGGTQVGVGTLKSATISIATSDSNPAINEVFTLSGTSAIRTAFPSTISSLKSTGTVPVGRT